MRVLVLNGPNLNLLGTREPEKYGKNTLEDIYSQLKQLADKLSVTLDFFQSNHEGALIDRLQRAAQNEDAVIFNPGAFTHYSYALRDVIAAMGIPTVEVHISNIYAREEFRKHSVIAPVAVGQITGLGPEGYLLALRAASHVVTERGQVND